MYTSKKDLLICKMFNLNLKEFKTCYMIILDEPYRIRFSKITELDIYAEGLTHIQAINEKEFLLTDIEIIKSKCTVNIMSMQLCYTIAYMNENKRLKRVERISKLRTLISTFNPIKRRLIYNRNPLTLIN